MHLKGGAKKLTFWWIEISKYHWSKQRLSPHAAYLQTLSCFQWGASLLLLPSTLSIPLLFPFWFPFFHCEICPWLTLSFLKEHLHLFKGRMAPLGPSRYAAEVPHIPVGRMGNVSVFSLNSPVSPQWMQMAFRAFYFQCYVLHIFQISLDYSSLFCYTHTVITWTLLKVLDPFEWSVHRMTVMLRVWSLTPSLMAHH